MWWCLKTETVPDFMAIIHVIIPVHTEYIPVHTGMYHFSASALRTSMYLVQTGTKTPDFVPPVTIPDGVQASEVRHPSHESGEPEAGVLNLSRPA